MLSFRRATVDDIGLIQILSREIWDECYPAIISQGQIDYMIDRMYATAVIRSQLEAGVIYEMIELAAQPRGYLSWSMADDIAWLHKLYLAADVRGRGNGQSALRRVIECAGRAGADRLRLTVNKQNQRALRAYEAAGFRPIDSVIKDIGGGFVMDDFILERPLGGLTGRATEA